VPSETSWTHRKLAAASVTPRQEVRFNVATFGGERGRSTSRKRLDQRPGAPAEIGVKYYPAGPNRPPSSIYYLQLTPSPQIFFAKFSGEILDPGSLP
jgi:hypothetical protein